MDLKYIYGINYNELLNKAFITIQEELNKSEDNKIILISDQKEDLEKKIRKSGIIDKDLKLQFVSLEDLCKITVKQTAHKNKKVLSESKKQILLSRIINNTTDLLEFHDICDSAQTTLLFSRTIKTLKDNRISVEQLKKIVPRIKNLNTKNKIADILNIYEKYEFAKKKLYLDNEDIITITANKIKEINFLKNAKVFLMDFERINPIQEDLIEEIIKNSLKTTIILNTDRIDRPPTLDSAHFFKIDLLINQINNLCKRNEIHFTEHVEVIPKKEYSELEHLKRYLYKYPFTTYSDKTEYLYINEYDSVYSEVENVALQILELSRNNVNLGTIKVVVPMLDKYNTTITTTFNKFKIPHCIQMNKKINSLPFIKILKILGNLYNDNFLHKDIIKYLKYSKQWNTEQISLLDNFLYSQATNKDFYFDIYLEHLEECNEIEQLVLLKDIIHSIRELFLQLDANTNTLDKCSILFEFLKKLWFGEDFNIEFVHVNMNREEIEAWNAISSTLSSLVEVFENVDINTSSFFEILYSNASKHIVEIDNLEIDKVKIVGLNSSHLETDFTFILNMNEGVANLKEQSEILLNAFDKKILSEVGINIEAAPESIALVEQYNIFKLLTRTNKSLYLSVPLSDFTEQGLKEAGIIIRLKQLFDNINKTPVFNKGYNPNISISNNSVWMNTIKLANRLNCEDTEIVISNLNKLRKLRSYKEYIPTLEQSLNFSNAAQCEDNYSLQNLYFGESFSVSKMERFNNCPFSYFIEYGLRVKPLEKNTPDHRHTGIFLHEIIEIFGKRVLKNNLLWNDIKDDYIESEVEGIANNLLKRKEYLILTSNNQSRMQIDNLKAIAVRSIKSICNHIGDSFFEPIGHEITFGDNATHPPITVKLNSGKRIKLIGQIDRVDKYTANGNDYVRIIDYKTGNTILNLSDIYNGLQLQLITYLDAVITNESKSGNNVLPAGVFYMKLNKPFIKSTPHIHKEALEELMLKEMRMNGLFSNEDLIPQYMDKEVFDGNCKNSLNINARFKTDGTLMKSTPGVTLKDFDTLISFTKETIKETITKMLSGDISIKPVVKAQQTPCNYCNYKLICLFDETLEGNNYKYIKSLKPMDALEKIRESVITNDE